MRPHVSAGRRSRRRLALPGRRGVAAPAGPGRRGTPRAPEAARSPASRCGRAGRGTGPLRAARWPTRPGVRSGSSGLERLRGPSSPSARAFFELAAVAGGHRAGEEDADPRRCRAASSRPAATPARRTRRAARAGSARDLGDPGVDAVAVGLRAAQQRRREPGDHPVDLGVGVVVAAGDQVVVEVESRRGSRPAARWSRGGTARAGTAGPARPRSRRPTRRRSRWRR